MKSYLARLDRFGEGNFFVKVDHSDSSVKSLEVRNKGSLGLACRGGEMCPGYKGGSVEMMICWWFNKEFENILYMSMKMGASNTEAQVSPTVVAMI